MIRTRTCASQGVGNFSFNKILCTHLHGWSPRELLSEIGMDLNIILHKTVILQEMFHQSLTYFSLMLVFYIPWKHQKTKGFLTFSGGIGIGLKWLKKVLGCTKNPTNCLFNARDKDCKNKLSVLVKVKNKDQQHKYK